MDEGDEYRVLTELLFPIALSRLSGSLSDVDATETKAIGLLAVDLAAVGALVAAHAALTALWWLPAVAAALASIPALVAAVPRARWFGPDLAAAQAVLAAREQRPVASARLVLGTLVTAHAKNRRLRERKTELCVVSLAALAVAAFASIPLAAAGAS